MKKIEPDGLYVSPQFNVTDVIVRVSVCSGAFEDYEEEEGC